MVWFAKRRGAHGRSFDPALVAPARSRLERASRAGLHLLQCRSETFSPDSKRPTLRVRSTNRGCERQAAEEKIARIWPPLHRQGLNRGGRWV